MARERGRDRVVRRDTGARTGALTVAALVAFAANSVLCRVALGGGAIDPASFTSIRLVSGAAVLLPLAAAWRSEGSGSAHGNWTSAAALAVYAVLFSFAYVSLDVGTGALLLFGAVQATMIGVALAQGERAQPLEWAGLVSALAGLVLLVLPGLTAPPLIGSSLMLGSGVAWGIYTLNGRGVSRPAAATAQAFLRASPVAVAVSGAAALGGDAVTISAAGIGLALASGVLASGLGYVVWYAALPGLGAIRAATVQLAVPVIAAAAGVVFLGEAVSPRLLLTGALILGGVGIALAGRSDVRRLRSGA